MGESGSDYWPDICVANCTAWPATDVATCSEIPSDSIQPMKSGPSPYALMSWSESRSSMSATANLEIVFPRRSRMGLPSASVQKPASSHEFPTNRISLPQTLVNAVNDLMVVFSLPEGKAAPTSLRRPVAAHSSARCTFRCTRYRRQVNLIKNIFTAFLKVGKPRQTASPAKFCGGWRGLTCVSPLIPGRLENLPYGTIRPAFFARSWTACTNTSCASGAKKPAPPEYKPRVSYPPSASTWAEGK